MAKSNFMAFRLTFDSHILDTILKVCIKPIYCILLKTSEKTKSQLPASTSRLSMGQVSIAGSGLNSSGRIPRQKTPLFTSSELFFSNVCRFTSSLCLKTEERQTPDEAKYAARIQSIPSSNLEFNISEPVNNEPVNSYETLYFCVLNP